MKKGLLTTLLFAFAVLASCNKNINRNIRKAIVTKENEAWVLTEYINFGIPEVNQVGKSIKEFQFQLSSDAHHYTGDILTYECDPNLLNNWDITISPTSNDSVRSKMRVIVNENEKQKDNRWGYLTITRDSLKYVNSNNNSITNHYQIWVLKLNKKEFQFGLYSDENVFGENQGYYTFQKKEIE